MSSVSPSSIKSFYRAKIHNSNNNSAKSSSKRQLDSSDNHSFKIPRTIGYGTDIVTLGDSDDEGLLTNEFAPSRGVSTPPPDALPFDVNEPVNTAGDPTKANLLDIFFLKSQNSNVLRSVYNSLSREVFNPRWVDFSEIDEVISSQKNPVLVLDSFDSKEFSSLKSKESLKIFSAFALLSINPRRSGDLTSFKHSRIASVCMKKVSLTCSGITDNSVIAEIRRKTRAMGGIFRPGLHAKTTHIVAKSWNSEKVKYFRKTNKPVMRPEWVFRCWEKREDIHDIKELDGFALPVFEGMNICVSGFDQQARTKIKQNVIANGGSWQSGILLDRYDFDTEDTIGALMDPNKKTTHLVVANKAGDKYTAAMADPDVKIVNLDWINVSLINGIPQMEDDPKYCLRDANAMNQLKRLEIERKKRQLQICSQNTANSTQDNLSLPANKDVCSDIQNLFSGTMISSTCVFDGLSFCFCGLDSTYHQNVKNFIPRLGGIVYNELVSAVTHVIIGPSMTSREAYTINRHEEKYRSIEKVDLDWVVKCADKGKLFPASFDQRLGIFLEKFKYTQDLPPNVAKEIAYERALKRADEFTKEIDYVEKLNLNNINFYKNKNINNDLNASKNGLRMGAILNSPKLKITEIDHSQRAITTASIPVGWESQPSN